MSKERDIEILEHKIAEIDRKVINFEKYDISQKKIDTLELLKLKYETQLEELQLA